MHCSLEMSVRDHQAQRIAGTLPAGQPMDTLPVAAETAALQNGARWFTSLFELTNFTSAATSTTFRKLVGRQRSGGPRQRRLFAWAKTDFPPPLAGGRGVGGYGVKTPGPNDPRPHGSPPTRPGLRLGHPLPPAERAAGGDPGARAIQQPSPSRGEGLRAICGKFPFNRYVLHVVLFGCGRLRRVKNLPLWLPCRRAMGQATRSVRQAMAPSNHRPAIAPGRHFARQPV